MMTHSATTDTGKTWWALGAGVATIGAAGVGWTLADVAGAAAAGGAVLAGAAAIRWAMTQKAESANTPSATTQQPGAHAAAHADRPDWATPKLAGFYNADSYKSETHTALTDSGTKSGFYASKAPRSRTGTDL